MKWLLNIARFILAAFVPGAIFIFISTKLNFDSEPFTLIVAMVSILFAIEVVSVQMGEPSVWIAISKSARDKFVFASGLILLGVFSAIPKYLEIKSQWVSLVIILLGFLVASVFLKSFGSKEMNDALSKPRKKIQN